MSLWAAWSNRVHPWTTAGAPEPPPPLERRATPAEQAAVAALADRVLGELRAAAARNGAPPALAALESQGEDGRPTLPSGLPDNPLAPGVAGVMDGCGRVPPPTDGIDWAYCPAPLRFEPAHIGAGITHGEAARHPGSPPAAAGDAHSGKP